MNEEAAPVTLVAALDGKTRASVAHDVHARAFDRCIELAIQVRAAFADLARGQEQMRANGTTIEDELPFPLNEAWATFRVKEFTKAEIRGDHSRTRP
jgi:hypothetical protein